MIPEHFILLEGLSVTAIPEGKITEATAGGKTIALLREGSYVYAFAATCPHAGVRFCEGWRDAHGNVVCPAHSYRFNPKNGYNASGQGYRLKTYKVHIEENRIFVAL